MQKSLRPAPVYYTGWLAKGPGGGGSYSGTYFSLFNISSLCMQLSKATLTTRFFHRSNRHSTSFDKFIFFVQLHVIVHRGAINTATAFGLLVHLPSAFTCNHPFDQDRHSIRHLLSTFIIWSVKTAPLILSYRRMAAKDERLFWNILRIPGSSRWAQPVHLPGDLPSCNQRAPSTYGPSCYGSVGRSGSNTGRPQQVNKKRKNKTEHRLSRKIVIIERKGRKALLWCICKDRSQGK